MAAGVAGAVLLGGCGGAAGGPGGPPGDFAVQVVVAPVVATSLVQQVEGVGNLLARDAIRVVSEVDATVRAIGFREGDRVEEGQVLFELDRAKLAAAQAEADARFRLAEANRMRAQTLVENGTISRQEFDQVEGAYLAAEAILTAAREDLADATLAAPFAGIVGNRRVSVGQFVRRGDVLVDLVRVDPLDIEMHVPERHAGGLRPGLRVTFASAAYPGEAFVGVVESLAPAVDASTRTLQVKAGLDNGDGRLRPGMFGRAAIELGAAVQTLVVPAGALSLSPAGASVVVVSAENKGVPRAVVAGRRFAETTEVVSGLEAGERVIVEGHHKLPPGASVVVSPKSAKYGIAVEAATLPQG